MRQQRIGLHIIIVCVCVYYYNNNNVVITETFVACTRVEKPNRRSLRFVFVSFFTTQHVYKYIIMNASRTNIGQSHCVAFDWRLKLAYLLTYLQTCIIKQSAVHSRAPAG